MAIDLDPRLTVIAGATQLERDALVNELIGSLNSGRPGTHLEFKDDHGVDMAIFRPHGAPHCVVDVERGIDVTARFSVDGTIDLLTPHGLDPHAARRVIAMDATELRSNALATATVERLAAVDPADLWNQAADVQYTLTDLRQTSEAAGTAPEDAEVVERIEHRHAAQVGAANEYERARRLSYFISLVCAIGAIPLWVLEGQAIAAPFLLFAAVCALISVVYWMRWGRVRNAESAVLSEVGVDSYLGFHLQRVETLLGNDKHRRRLIAASEAYHLALADWEALAGDVSVDWALEHQDDITVAHDRFARDGAAPAPAESPVEAMARVLIGRLDRLAGPGAGGTALPLILDEPFAGTDGEQIAQLLELLLEHSTGRQIVILSKDDRIISWGRVASRDGLAGVVEMADAIVADADRDQAVDLVEASLTV
jgi:hypothetical protein